MKIKKIVMILIFSIVMINLIVVPQVYALDNPGGIISGADDFITAGGTGAGQISKDNLNAVSSAIYNILLVIATILAVGILSVLGIKYMTASVEGKAEVKQSIIPFIIGCIVVFGSFAIWKLIISLTANF